MNSILQKTSLLSLLVIMSFMSLSMEPDSQGNSTKGSGNSFTLNSYKIIDDQNDDTKGENIMILHNAASLPATTIILNLEIINDNQFVGFQLDIPINNGFWFVPGSAVLNPERATNHILEAGIYPGTNLLRLLSVSFTNAAFKGNSGTIVSFALHTPDVAGVYTLEIVNGIIGNISTQNILTQAINATVTIYEGSQIPDELFLNNVMFNAGIDTCFAATQTIVVSAFIVNANASVILTAGGSIHLLPETRVEPNAYLLARISDGVTYCNQPPMMIASGELQKSNEIQIEGMVSVNSMVIVYPNPSNGTFTLHSVVEDGFVNPTVSIFNLMGELVTNVRLSGQRTNISDFSSKPKGIYILKVESGNQTQIEKLIIQ